MCSVCFPIFFRIKSWPETIDSVKIVLSVLKSICVRYVGVVMTDGKYNVGSHSAGICNVRMFIAICGFNMNNVFSWEQTRLVLVKLRKGYCHGC